MFVSRRNLSFIHLAAGKVMASLHIAQSFHQGAQLLGRAGLCGILQQPFTECDTERLMLKARNLTRLLNEILIGAQRDIFHTISVSVYTLLSCNCADPA